jgi:hypothetical protein
VAADRISTRISSGLVSSTDATIENGNPIIVDGIVINNMNGFFGQYFKMTNTNGETILNLYIPAGGTVTYYNSFMADRGVVIKAGSTYVSYSIFYKLSG